MENKTIQRYTNVSRDVRLNNIPARHQDGSYMWSRGQLDILNDPQFNRVKDIQTEIRKASNQRESLLVEMLNMKNPVNRIENEGDIAVQNLKGEIEEEQIQSKSRASELSQFDEDLFNRGIYLNSDLVKSPIIQNKGEGKSLGFSRKSIISFLLTWFLAEVFMTFVQWDALRDYKGIESLIVRSLSFAAVLFLIHLVPHAITTRTKYLYYSFLGFCMLMLVIMLFAPPLLYNIYPPDTDLQSVQEQWSFNGDSNIVPQSTYSSYPLWVRFYRSYEVTPAILCLLLYILLMVYVKIQNRLHPENQINPKVESDSNPESNSMTDGLRQKREQFLTRITECENSISRLKASAEDSLSSNTGRLKEILNFLQMNKEEILAMDNRISDLKVNMEWEVKNMERELDAYKTDYLDILRNDAVKTQFVNPEWPNRNDIINYYKV